MRKHWLVLMTLLLVLALALAACGGDDDNDADDTSQPTPTAESMDDTQDDGGATSFDPGASSISLSADLGGGSDLPGCSDPDDEECPAALVMDLDGEVTADGVTINYPSRYFDALTGEESPDALIQIVPSENNRYAETAVFSVVLMDDPATALEKLPDAETAEWSTDTLTGTIAVSKDETLDPQINTTFGAFTTEDGRGVLVQLVTTGKYGWDLWSRVYASMLDTLVLPPAE